MSNGKRILFLADVNSIHTQRWVSNLIEKGYEIGIFSLSAQTTSWTEKYESIQCHCYGLGDDIVRSKKRFSKLSYFSSLSELKDFHASFAPDIVHAHYASSYGMLAMRLKFPKTILSLWGSDVYEFPKRSVLHKLLLKRVLKRIPVVCSTSKDMAREAGIYVERDYFITPFGVDTAHFSPAKQSNEVLVVGTVKSLEHVYGIDRLLKVFASFSEKYEQPIELHIYGKGAEENELKEQAKQLGISDKVSFKGFVSEEALIQAFRSLDVFIALSRRESYGVAALEAQACGVPVIVSNVGGLPEVVGDKAGFIVDGEDIDSCVKHLIALTDVNLRESMGNAARNHVEANFSEQACVNKLIEVYDRFETV